MPRQTPSSGIPRSSARAGQGELEPVALGPGAARLRMRGRAVGGGIDVRAAGEDQRVDAVEQRVGRLGHGLVGRQQQRQRAGRLHRGGVGARQHGHRVLPGAPARPLERRADPDRAAAHPGLTAGSAALEHAPALVVGDDLVEQPLLGTGRS